ncbi:protein-associating with the carboxyl-terminal domain of ezrin isoform X2 [Alligator sinensis]|uniref:Protein-associating with the carboxyl-terminal domain of ezrin isoform X2 n=1 Tax=Alligator sinensis TaxID=38654 RepID=A0A3Q0FZ54_ALLSI|nr:protein-associating with the carboxyl-terminal domain of ezrin isoform X2 [Alligator sinensis]
MAAAAPSVEETLYPPAPRLCGDPETGSGGRRRCGLGPRPEACLLAQVNLHKGLILQVMGSENSALKNNTLEKQPFTLPSGIKIYPAVLQDGKLASVCVYERENEDKVNKAAKHLKTLRHPCLLRFLSCTVETDGIHLVTERVKPLSVILKLLSSAEICSGIYDILLALVFLHERFLREIKSVRDQAGIPPEEMSADFCILSESHGHARDAYSFGTMIENLLTILNDQVSADILSSFQQTLHCTLLNPDPKCRPPLSSLLSHEFFRNDFLEVVNFLKSLTVKTEEEKTEFFKFLPDRVACFSEELIASRLVPLLLNQLVFAEPVAVKSFLPHLLGPKKDNIGDCHTSYLLSPALFQTHVIPVLLKLFEVHEEHVRMVLLSHIDTYAELFTRDELKNIILPQVLLGLRDSSDNIVAITLHSLAVLVSLLGPEVVVGGERSKIFKRSVPSFTKTTDLSPDDSPVCILSNQRNQLSQPLQKNSSSVYPKCPISENVPISSKKYPSRPDTHVALKMSKQDPQLSLNGLPEGINALGNSRSILNISEKLSEEWPDWSESEDTETDKTVNIQIQTREPCSSTDPYFAEHNADEEPWDDFEPSSPNPELSSGNSLDVTTPDAVTGQRLFPPILQLSRESRSLKLSPPLKSTPMNSWSNDNWEFPDKLGKTTMLPKTLQERPKSAMETGLGEEFTIQVKRKPVQDPELDWFADMIPDIKPSSPLLLLPELRTESVGPSYVDADSNSEDVSQIMPFSSRFAAVEVTEADAAGWDEEEELNWEDDTNW